MSSKKNKFSIVSYLISRVLWSILHKIEKKRYVCNYSVGYFKRRIQLNKAGDSELKFGKPTFKNLQNLHIRGNTLISEFFNKFRYEGNTSKMWTEYLL